MEKRINTRIQQYISAFKDDIKNKMTDVQFENNKKANDLLEYVYEYERLVLEKDEERNLFCFSMSSSVNVDIKIAGFKTVTNFKLFDLERYDSNEY